MYHLVVEAEAMGLFLAVCHLDVEDEAMGLFSAVYHSVVENGVNGAVFSCVPFGC